MLKFIGEEDIGESKNGSVILLTIAYGAGVGGLATPLGGAMNLVTVEYIEELTGQEFMYTSWVIRFLPIMLVLVVSNVIFLVVRHCRKGDRLAGSKEYFVSVYKEMPKMTKEEIFSFLLFVIATVLSFTRQLYQDFLPGLKPAYVFIVCAVLSFFVKKKDGERLMKWKYTQGKILWELIYIFAGGLALGTLINKSGAADDIGGADAAAAAHHRALAPCGARARFGPCQPSRRRHPRPCAGHLDLLPRYGGGEADGLHRPR